MVVSEHERGLWGVREYGGEQARERTVGVIEYKCTCRQQKRGAEVVCRELKSLLLLNRAST